MKRILSVCLVVAMTLTMLFVVGCGDKKTETPDTATPKTVKFGAGVYVSAPTATDASVDAEGTGKFDVTVAAVTVDADGKIVACDVDTASNSVKFTLDGKAVANDGFQTKGEAGADYNMVAYGGAKKEWFEQADAFEKLVSGKTLAEVKALVGAENKGNDEVVAAGCTIMIHEFVGAIEKAYNSAKDSKATAADAVKVTVYTEQTCTDATADKDGTNKVATTVFAAAVGADGKVTAAHTDCVEVSFTFTTEGVSTLDTAKAVLSKYEQGKDYNMVAYGGAAKEWFEQADAFAATCIGKTASEIAGFAGEDGKGTADVQSAGCTILVTGFVKAAEKIK